MGALRGHAEDRACWGGALSGGWKRVVTRRATQVAMVCLVGIAVYAMLGSLPLPGVVAGWLGAAEDLPMRTIRHAPMVDLSESAYYATPMFVGLLVVFVVCLAVATAFGVRRRWGALPVWLTHVGVVVLAVGAGWYATHKREVLMPVYAGQAATVGYALDREELVVRGERGAQRVGVETPTYREALIGDHSMVAGAVEGVELRAFEPFARVVREIVADETGKDPFAGAVCRVRRDGGAWFTMHAMPMGMDRLELGGVEVVLVGDGLWRAAAGAHSFGSPEVVVRSAGVPVHLNVGSFVEVDAGGTIVAVEVLDIFGDPPTAVVWVSEEHDEVRGWVNGRTLLVPEATAVGWGRALEIGEDGVLAPAVDPPVGLSLVSPSGSGSGGGPERVWILGGDGGRVLGDAAGLEVEGFLEWGVLESRVERSVEEPEALDHPDPRLGRAVRVAVEGGREEWVPFSSLGDRVVESVVFRGGLPERVELSYRGAAEEVEGLPGVELSGFEVLTFPGGSIPRDFRVVLGVGDGEIEVGLNRPARVGPWTLSLTAWDLEGVSETGEARFVVMLVGNRPGIVWVIVGGVMIASGFVVSSAVRVRGLLWKGGGA